MSTEYAVRYYDLIPEGVEDLTSLTAKKTARLSNSSGTFVFRHVKTSLFFGFTRMGDETRFLSLEPLGFQGRGEGRFWRFKRALSKNRDNHVGFNCKDHLASAAA
ncbi:MAG: hypothetical protein ACE5IO_09805 [Thermoplasmata archaeon]